MPLTAVQITRIQDRVDGWEADFRHLLTELLPKMEERSRDPKFTWPCEDDRQEFFSEVVAKYVERASEGTLLAAYDDSMGDPVQFLTGRAFHCWALDKLVMLACRPIQMITKNERGDWTPFEVEDARSISQNVQPNVHEGLFQHLRLNLPAISKIDRVLEQAGLQLFPRLDWALKEMTNIRRHLISLRAEADPELDWLAGHHVERQSQLNTEIDKHRAKLYYDEPGAGTRREAFLRHRIARLCFERIFLPLTAVVIDDILGVGRQNADQLRHRYRKALPRLLPQFPGLRRVLERGDV